MEMLARQYGVRQMIRFWEVASKECFWLMVGVGARVLPSVWPESLPTAAVESIGIGVPVVGSGLGGIPEVVDGYGAAVARGRRLW